MELPSRTKTINSEEMEIAKQRRIPQCIFILLMKDDVHSATKNFPL